jgi:hypothetical protein
MKKIKLAYWVCMLIIAFTMVAGGVYDLLAPPEVLEVMRRLGYPDYFPVWLGAAKVLGMIVLLAPRMGTFREWAYAGFTFNLLAAGVAHIYAGDPIGAVLFPLALLIPLFTTYFLRKRIDRAKTVA